MLPDIHPLFGGCGGVYFLAEPGELVVEVVKRDRNRRATTAELRAILVGPDRQVLQEVSIPDDGEPVGGGLGPVGRATLSTTVPRKGVYALNITVSRDRYGQNMVWGFRSNCPRYLIETARGHKDARHQEPIFLADTGQPHNVCFLPRRGAFKMDLSGLSKQEPYSMEQARSSQLWMSARTGRQVTSFPPTPPAARCPGVSICPRNGSRSTSTA